MDESTKTRDKNKIQTFVFLDLEATGLPGDDPRILEIAMIAVAREHLLGMKSPNGNGMKDSDSTEGKQKASVPKLPRVLHKYVRLYYPRKLLTPKLEELTGLNNDLLHRLPGFSQESAEAIRLFLDFPKPVALVAHNGSRFDFPLLKAELKNVISMDKFPDLHCVDTLKAVKDIDALHLKEKEVSDIKEITELAASFCFEDMDDEMMEVVQANKKARCEEPLEERVNQAFHSTCRFSEPSSQAVEVNQRLLEVSAEPLMTPVKDVPPQTTNIPATPQKPKKPPSPPITPESIKAYTAGTPDFNPQTFTETNKVRRSLSYGGNGKRKWDGTKPYTQSNIYKRLFGMSYEAHKAEADSQAMLEICGHYGDEFVKWADSFADKFINVKPMWTRRKTFKFS